MAHVLWRSGGVPRSDAREFIPALEAAFTRLERDEGPVATPAIATWLGLQSPDAFDAIVIPPEGGGTPDTAVVLLHGYMGNFAVYCWQMARAVRAVSALTVCPSVGPRGDWWSAQGERTLERTYAWLVQRGVRRVYLGGSPTVGWARACSWSGPGIRACAWRASCCCRARLPRLPSPGCPCSSSRALTTR